MKEIIKIKIEKDLCEHCNFRNRNCNKMNNCPPPFSKVFYQVRKEIFNDFKETKVEQVPETFEELKELCKGLKCKKSDLDNVIWFELPKPKDTRIWLGKFLCLDIKGQVGMVEKTFGNDVSITIFATNRTPKQMWNIILNLVEEVS